MQVKLGDNKMNHISCCRYMVGSLLFGVLYDRYNRHIMLAVCTFGFAVFNGVKPFCSVFPVMVAVQLLNYIFSGGLDTGRLLECSKSEQKFLHKSMVYWKPLTGYFGK